MIRKTIWTVEVHGCASTSTRLRESFDHEPTVESLKEALIGAIRVWQDMKAEHDKCEDKDDHRDDILEKQRKELDNLEQLICIIKPETMRALLDTRQFIHVAGTMIGSLSLETSNYLSRESARPTLRDGNGPYRVEPSGPLEFGGQGSQSGLKIVRP